jgi:peptidylprolyl isomerase
MHRRFLLAALPLLSAGVVAGCGSSNSDTASIQPPPSESQTLTFTATTTSSTGPTGPTIVTPSHGALSVRPTITVPKTSPPKSLVSKDLITGTGAAAKAGDTITVNYVGALYNNGKVFDASWDRNQPYSTPIGEGALIKGWDEGMLGMRVGGRRELIIPPSLAYGKTGQGPIPGNSTLVFIVDLLGLTPPSGSTVSGATVATGALGTTGGTGSTGSTGATG